MRKYLPANILRCNKQNVYVSARFSDLVFFVAVIKQSKP